MTKETTYFVSTSIAKMSKKPEITESKVIELIREGTVKTLKELRRILEDDSKT